IGSSQGESICQRLLVVNERLVPQQLLLIREQWIRVWTHGPEDTPLTSVEPAGDAVDVLRLDSQFAASLYRCPPCCRGEEGRADAMSARRWRHADVPQHGQVSSALQHVDVRC